MSLAAESTAPTDGPTRIILQSPSPIVGIPVKETNPELLKPDAKRDFERAWELLEKGEESSALVSFTDFLRRYPHHNLAGEAQFNVGEIFFRQRRYREALVEFQRVREYAAVKKTKFPAAVLRIGECFQKLGETEKAQIEWNALVRRFPDSPAAEQAKVLLKGLP